MKLDISAIRKSGKGSVILVIALVVILALVLSQFFVHLLTDVWWFQSIGFLSVFWTRITWQVVVWVVTFVAYGLFLYANYRIAMYLTRDRSFEAIADREWERYAGAIPYLAGGIIILFALVAASGSVGAWETILKFLNPSEFGVADPIYQRDIGFYLFRLPFYEGLQSWLLTLCIWGLIAAVLIYGLKGAISFGRRSGSQGSQRSITQQLSHLLTGNVKIHLSILLAAIALLVATDFWLSRYDLLYSTDGVVFGAGFTDVHARLQAYYFMLFATLALALIFIATLWRRSFSWSVYGIGIYVIAYFLAIAIYPWAQQRFIVQPNELQKERPYIANNIALTNQAFDLEQVRRRSFPAKNDLSREDLDENQATIRNIRLWDYRPLLSTYQQLQEIRPYYSFEDVDIDRYTIDGNYRQVMLAARELDYDQVPEDAQTWVNQRLKYTHGYGLVMNPVNQVTPQGLPDFFIRNIPPVSEVDLAIAESAIYYGEETDNYIFTGMSTEEFDYPQGGSNAYTTYEGNGGVPIPSIWQRLAYAYDLGSLEILISNYFTDASRIHYRRQIRQRIQEVAPFLQLDNDPYITLIDGRLQWIVDAYTVSDRYPYSEPVDQTASMIPGISVETVQPVQQDDFNYIRNSVKVVVDAFDGTLRFLVVDEDDPVLNTYRKIFPSLFTASDAISPSVRDHFRYPLDLFKTQSQVYLLYHMTDPEVFYNREDLWRFPTEVYEGNEQIVEPYYVIMSLPEVAREEFIVILPFVPVSRDNMIAWMAGRSDGENYGELLLYEFPKQELVYGPSQIEARIDQNPEISQQLTLWSQEGSRVIRGDLLVIPIEETLIYVEPVYLRAEQGELPELRRVIVVYGDQVVMEETLEQTLAVIFGQAASQPQEPSQQPPIGEISNTTRSLITSVIETYQRAQSALTERDWQTYGQAQEELDSLIQQLQQQTPTQ
jgi:hypothetical protein